MTVTYDTITRDGFVARDEKMMIIIQEKEELTEARQNALFH